MLQTICKIISNFSFKYATKLNIMWNNLLSLTSTKNQNLFFLNKHYRCKGIIFFFLTKLNTNITITHLFIQRHNCTLNKWKRNETQCRCHNYFHKNVAKQTKSYMLFRGQRRRLFLFSSLLKNFHSSTIFTTKTKQKITSASLARQCIVVNYNITFFAPIIQTTISW